MPSASAWSSPPVPRPRTVPARIALPLVPPGPAGQIDRALRARVRPGVASVVSDLAEAGPKNAASGCRPSVFRRSQPDRVRTRRRRRLPRTPTVASLTDGCSHRMAGAHCQTTCGASFHFTAYGSAGVRVRPTHVAPRPKFPCARRAQRCDRAETMSTTHASLPPALDMGPGGPVARFLCGGGVVEHPLHRNITAHERRPDARQPNRPSVCPQPSSLYVVWRGAVAAPATRNP